MKKITILSIFLILFCFVGCGPTKTTYIEILEPDIVFLHGEIVYRVEPGDTLKVLNSIICRGTSKTCWKVWDMEKKESGYVVKQRMEKKHRTYQKKE